MLHIKTTKVLLAIEIPSRDNDAFGVIVPGLPGCFSAGDDLDSTIANAREAILMHSEEESPEPETNLADMDLVLNTPEDYQHAMWRVIEAEVFYKEEVKREN